MWSPKRTQHPRLSIGRLRKMQGSIRLGEEYRALLTDHSKAFDCLSHDFILAKLRAYGFSLESLKLMKLFNRS